VTGLLGLVLRATVVVFLVRLLLRFVAAVMRGYRGDQAPRPDSRRGAAADLVRDRVCNTFVPRSRALTARVDGEDAYFCSAACRDAASAAARRAS